MATEATPANDPNDELLKSSRQRKRAYDHALERGLVVCPPLHRPRPQGRRA